MDITPLAIGTPPSLEWPFILLVSFRLLQLGTLMVAMLRKFSRETFLKSNPNLLLSYADGKK